jgi:hypothetical protein
MLIKRLRANRGVSTNVNPTEPEVTYEPEYHQAQAERARHNGDTQQMHAHVNGLKRALRGRLLLDQGEIPEDATWFINPPQPVPASPIMPSNMREGPVPASEVHRSYVAQSPHHPQQQLPSHGTVLPPPPPPPPATGRDPRSPTFPRQHW